MTVTMSRAAFRYSRFAGAALLVAATSGCASWLPANQPVKGGIAETDATLSTPMRPAGTPENEKLPWYDFRNILDPRSRDIERHLGV